MTDDDYKMVFQSLIDGVAAIKDAVKDIHHSIKELYNDRNRQNENNVAVRKDIESLFIFVRKIESKVEPQSKDVARLKMVIAIITWASCIAGGAVIMFFMGRILKVF